MTLRKASSATSFEIFLISYSFGYLIRALNLLGEGGFISTKLYVRNVKLSGPLKFG